jgi:mRNA-degrading endonuclease RelE of RelBE toxin-antitoxin system
MSYRVDLLSKAAGVYESLTDRDLADVDHALDNIAASPYHHDDRIIKLTGTKNRGLWRYKTKWGWRLVYTIDGKGKIVVVNVINQKSNHYLR